LSEEMMDCPRCFENVPSTYILCPFCGYDLTRLLEVKFRPPVYMRDRIRRAKGVVLDPLNTMTEIAENPDGKGVVLILLFYAFLSMIKVAVYAYHINIDYVGFSTAEQSSVNSSLAKALLALIFLGSMIFLLLPLFILFLGSFVIWLVIKLLGGKGTYFQTRVVVGYSLVPVLLGEILSILILFLGLSDVSVTVTSGQGMSDIVPNMVTAIEDMQGQGVVTATNYLILLFWIWAALLMTIGIARAHRMSYYEVGALVFIPVIGFAVLLAL